MPHRLARLKTRADFLRIAAGRRRAAAPGVVVQAATRPAAGSDGEIRVGFTASRKVGNAVIRNRAKRRLRAAAAQVVAEHGYPGTDYVLIARAATAERPYRALVADLAGALRRLDRAVPPGRKPAAEEE